MPDVWLPGAVQRPGANAGYTNGKNRMQFAVEHFTVGTHSESIGDRGFFTILFPKIGPPLQFCEIDALCWHAGPWNPYGPGAEWERLGYEEDLTADQLAWGAKWHQLCHEWGIPLVHARYDGPGSRFDPTSWHGFADHGAIDDQRSDGITTAEFDAMTGDDVLNDDDKKWLHEQIAVAATQAANQVLRVLVGRESDSADRDLIGNYEQETRKQIIEHVDKKP